MTKLARQVPEPPAWDAAICFVGEQLPEGPTLAFATDAVETENDGEETEENSNDCGEIDLHQHFHQVAALLKVLAEVLEDLGYTVTCKADGAEALSARGGER